MPATIIGNPITESIEYDGYHIDTFFFDTVNGELRITYTMHISDDDADVFKGKKGTVIFKDNDYLAQLAKYPELYNNMKTALYAEMDIIFGVSSNIT